MKYTIEDSNRAEHLAKHLAAMDIPAQISCGCMYFFGKETCEGKSSCPYGAVIQVPSQFESRVIEIFGAIIKNNSRKQITKEQVVQLIQEWDIKGQSQFAREFGVSQSAVYNMAKYINTNTDGKYCNKKGQTTRKQLLIDALALLD